MTFEECMKNSFAETGVAPQCNIPVWRACQYAWDIAYSAGVQAERERCHKIAEELDIEPGTCNEYGELTRKYDSWVNGVNDACSQIATAIRGQKDA